MSNQIARSLHHDWQENTDGTVTITTRQDVTEHLKLAAEARSVDRQIGSQLTTDSGLHLVGSIPACVVQQLRDTGFDIFSPEKSGMTPEEHQAHILKLLCGDLRAFNMSRFERLA